jgi:hypothetical protein
MSSPTISARCQDIGTGFSGRRKREPLSAFDVGTAM